MDMIWICYGYVMDMDVLWIWICYGYGYAMDMDMLWIWICYERLLLGQCANKVQLVRFLCTGPVSEVQLVTRLRAHSVQPQDTINWVSSGILLEETIYLSMMGPSIWGHL